MKPFLCLALFAVIGCGKSNDVATLQHEANHVATFYAPKIDALDKRVQQIFKRGTTIPANLPGIEEVGKRLTEARDMIQQLRPIVWAPDGKAAVIKQADMIASDKKVGREKKVADLRKLVHDSEETLEKGTTIIADDLAAVESWISLYDQYRTVKGNVPPPPLPTPPEAMPPTPTPNPNPAPNAPAPANTPAAPAPAAPSPAQPAPAHP